MKRIFSTMNDNFKVECNKNRQYGRFETYAYKGFATFF
ncbi:hypothetical protein ND16A_3214 [Thalassotalea sp. ND16A]|nr:hypothetical protein ND16A_3214 [Thalassotalea sp. ND16A]